MPNRYLKKDEALVTLRKLLKPGATVWTVLRHVSSSGMSRAIDMYAMHKNEPVCISHLMAAVSSYNSHPQHSGIKVSGAGMDMGFHVVYSLGSIMWPTGTPKPHGTRNGEPDRDGGYALKQRWL